MKIDFPNLTTGSIMVRFYSMYSDLSGSAAYSEINKIMGIHRQRDAGLYETVHVKHRIPLFPMSLVSFMMHRDALLSISREQPDFSWLIYVLDDGTVEAFNQGNVTKHPSHDEAIGTIMGVRKFALITSKVEAVDAEAEKRRTDAK